MNIKTTISFVSSVFILLSVVGSSFAQENDIKNRLRVRFPRMQVGEIRQSGIDGLYEVEAGPNILYYYPKSELVVFGEIWNSAGKSLTAERRSEIFSRKVRDIPLDKAGLKIGNGKNVVIEFTNPDCNYCRKGYEYMKSRDDVTEYIFFLPFNKTSESKVSHILCSKDKEKAYDVVMTGKMDGKQLELCDDASVTKLIEEHKQLALKAGVNGTPAYWINNKFINGANIALIESYIGKPKK